MNLHSVPLWYMEEVWKDEALNRWWTLLSYGPEGEPLSNIRIGDLFTLGKFNQFGLICGKTTNIGADVAPFFTYRIDGEIGGHRHHPKHDWFTGGEVGSQDGYIRWIPNATQLQEMAVVLRSATYAGWCRRLMEHYCAHPLETTHRSGFPRGDL